MSSTARWSLKSLAFSVTINCSAQEYGTPSTTNGEGDHCEKYDGGCQNSTNLSAEYSREGSKADGANPTEAVLVIWAYDVPVREHRASGARCESEPTVSRLVSSSLFGEKSQEAALTAAPEGAGGSKLLLLDERCDYSVDLRE